MLAQLKRIIEARRRMGEPFPAAVAARVLALANRLTAGSDIELERILNQYTLLRVQLNKSGIGECTPGGAVPQLLELGWRSFIVRVVNPARLKGSLTLSSSVAIAEGLIQPGIHDSHVLGNDLPEIREVPPDIASDSDLDATRWMGYRFGSGLPLDRGLEGLPLEYLLLQIYSQQAGSNSALVFIASASLQPFRLYDCKGSRLEFTSAPASTVALGIRDSDGVGTTASLLIKDDAGRLYPAPGHRVEPDLGYQPEIYRADGESVRLPVGRYEITALRGPEYLETHQVLIIPPGAAPAQLILGLKRWIDPAQLGWYCGDPHIHPGGQVFGLASKYGLTPETLLRQVRGEGLSVGSILIWADGYYYEKQFLTGHVYEPNDRQPFPELQRANNTSMIPHRTLHDGDSLIRYDVEQAAFPSNRLGHPVLLKLKNHDYPGGKSIYDWPSWNLPVLQWGKAQGAVVGYAHGGGGMPWNNLGLPNFEIPAFEGLGANECLVDVTHGAVDFVAGCETHPVRELNFWYHLLNCGFWLPMIGETDFYPGLPGSTGEGWYPGKSRVGTGRTYVQLDRPPHGDAGYDAWVDGLKAGRLYFGDGRSHLIDFRANDRPVGNVCLSLPSPGQVSISVRISARLDETPLDPDDERLTRPNSYWHLERARIGSSRRVSLEVVVNGQVAERREVLADGAIRPLLITIDMPRSSWIALRILPSAHTAPLFVSVAGQPVRVSRRSAQWCLDCVEVLWNQHANRIRESERDAARVSWDHARESYLRILGECIAD